MMFFTFSSDAYALKNENLYKWCKAYTDSGFEISSSNSMCLAYVAGIRDLSQGICLALNNTADTSRTADVMKKFFAVSLSETSTDSIIQHYVNEMRQSPQDWDQNAASYVVEAISAFAPCE